MVSAVELCRESELVEAVRQQCHGVEIQSEMMASSLILTLSGALLLLLSLEDQDLPES